MPGSESTHSKISRVRTPRVHITYEVEKGGAMVQKELPFVLGVLADLSGQPEQALPKLKERKFVEIDRDNFDRVLKGAKPRLAFKVDNTLTGGDTRMGVELRFETLDDFAPEQVVEQVDPLRKLLEVRRALSGLLAKTDGNDLLSERLGDLVRNTEELTRIAGGPGGTPGSETTE